MIPVKVVLASIDGEKEVELGPFNQGIVAEPYEGNLAMIDVAGDKVVVRCLNEGLQRAGTTSIYARAFIQPDLDVEEIQRAAIDSFAQVVIDDRPWAGLADLTIEERAKYTRRALARLVKST